MDYPQFDLTDKIVLVTGASRGIGYDVAKAMAHAGATVVAGARDWDALERLIQEIADEGCQAVAIKLDMRDLVQIRAVVDFCVERYGRLDVLVNNAGVGRDHETLDVTEADWDELIDVNLKGAFFMAQAAGKQMIQQGSGRIINMSSQAGTVALTRAAVYCASKGGLNMLTKVMAIEWGSLGVTVNAIAPTFIRTPGTAERLDDPEFGADVLSRIPLGRVGTTMDVAGAVIFLASSASGLINGEILHVDGGWTAR
jgi:NAD(P)-dependent dehydrogenase (short-subunit alcohol dehydrogenase family)